MNFTFLVTGPGQPYNEWNAISPTSVCGKNILTGKTQKNPRNINWEALNGWVFNKWS